MEQNQKHFTIIPKDLSNGVNKEMLDGLPPLPASFYMTAIGDEASVKFPVFLQDPSFFLDTDKFDVVSVKDLKDKMRPFTLGTTSAPEEFKHIYQATDIQGLEIADKMKCLHAMLLEYQKRPIVGEAIGKVFSESLNDNLTSDMPMENKIISSVAYLGHYFGEEFRQQFMIATTPLDYQHTDIDLKNRIIGAISGAEQVYARQDGAIKSIVSDMKEEAHPPLVMIQTFGAAIDELGLDSKHVHTLAHRAGFESNFVPTVENVIRPRNMR